VGASGRSASPAPQEKKSQAPRLLLAVVGAAGLWIALWRAIGRSGSEPTREPDRAAPPASADAPKPPVSADVDRKSAGAEVVPTTDAPLGPQPVPGIRLYGSVMRALEREPTGVPTKLKIADEEWEERETETGGLAKYEFKDLHPGHWDLDAAASGLRTLHASVDLDGKETDVRLDLFLEPTYVIRVRLDASLGEGISMMGLGREISITGLKEVFVARAADPHERFFARAFSRTIPMEVLATAEEPGRFLEMDDRSNYELGTFRAAGTRILTRPGSPVQADPPALRDLPEEYCGVLETTEPPPLFVSLVVHGFVIRSAAVPPGADEVTLPLTRADLDQLPATVHLKVVDAETGDRPADLHVQLGSAPAEPQMTRNEPDGSVTIGPTLPGPATLTLTASDRERIEESITVLPGKTDLGTFRMQPVAYLRADVADGDGKPAVVSFDILPMDRYEQARKPLGLRSFSSNTSGVLEVASVGRGHYLLAVRDPNWAAMPAVADTSIGRKGHVDIRVTKGVDVALKLRAEPPPNARLSIRTTSGLPVDDRKCHGRETMRFRLTPGLYSVELFDGETWLATERLDVGSEPIRRYFPR